MSAAAPTIWKRIELDGSFEATIAPAAVRKPRFACAVDTFVASDAAELSLMHAAILQVLDDDGAGWLRGELVDAPLPRHARPSGWFPSMFVSPVVLKADGTFMAE